MTRYAIKTPLGYVSDMFGEQVAYCSDSDFAITFTTMTEANIAMIDADIHGVVEAVIR